MRSCVFGSAYSPMFWTVLAIFCSAPAVYGQSLIVTYGAKGIQTLSYGSTVLENTGLYSADVFQIGHLQCTDLQGNIINDSRCTWGETNNGETWNSSTKTELYNFPWGNLATQFAQNGNNLDITVTETNNAGSGIVLIGSDVIPLALHFPNDPLNFYGYNQNVITTTGPAVAAADFGTGVVTSVVPDESPSLYGGWKAQGGAVYSPIIASTAPGGLATFYPRVSSPVQPGQSLSYTISLRFTPEGTAANAQDAYSSFAAKYPSQMTWTDKRVIGTAYLATSASGDPSQPAGFPTNPRRYYNDPSIDVTTSAGLKAFQVRMLAQATSNVANAQSMNAQGVITWDIEGQQFPQTTSYVCSPDQIAVVAPEMESVVSDASSPYYGKKLDDAYFATMTSAGLKAGVCLRPQAFTLAPADTASQVYLSSNAAIVANLEKKAKYANSRWGVTLFYVDSTVDANGGVLDPAIFQQLITDMPGVLFIPEESTPRYYAYSAPFYTFIFHTDLGTPVSIYNTYPNAFGANLVNDVDPTVLAKYQTQLTQSVARGDILMGHADWWQPNDPTLVQIYANAAGGAIKKTPQITWPAPSPVVFGTPLSATQLDATVNVPGSFIYLPAAGAVLTAGTTVLQTTFSPADPSTENVATSSVNLTVTQASPLITWTTPNAVNQGTTLSSAQLNATANVPGVFSYSPAAGTAVNAGATLHAVFNPSDTLNYASQTASVYLATNDSTPQPVTIISPAAGASVSGTISVTAQITVPLDPAGSYLMVDGTPIGTRRISSSPYAYPLDTFTLSNGPHTLQVWAHDIGNNNRLSAPVSITVTNGGSSNAVVTWPAPSAIVYGTALSSSQLSATANVPGTFTYSPSAGTVLNAGTQILNAVFTPSDATKYSATKAGASLVVQKAIPSIQWAAPASVSEGTVLSSAQLNAIASVSGILLYSPAAGTVLNAGITTLSVSLTPADQTNYASQTTSVALTITSGPKAAAITWPAPPTITYGTSLSGAQLNATANVPGSFSYMPAAGTILRAGTTTLSVTFSAADVTRYQTATATVQLQVQPGTPAIAWPAPSAVTEGTAISSAQLNATANVAGAFVYSPSAGTVLPAGSNLLRATFTPADQVDYTSQTAQVALLVNNSTLQPVVILSPAGGATLSGTVSVSAQITVPLDPAGSYLMVDGAEIGTRRVSDRPYLYSLDTTTLSNGQHTIQIWAHDIGNNVRLSAPVVVNIRN